MNCWLSACSRFKLYIKLSTEKSRLVFLALFSGLSKPMCAQHNKVTIYFCTFLQYNARDYHVINSQDNSALLAADDSASTLISRAYNARFCDYRGLMRLTEICVIKSEHVRFSLTTLFID